MKVFVDGSAGTTGLRIVERLQVRSDLSVVVLPEEVRKDVEARKEAINGCDVAVLCLPDDAAKEAVGLIYNEKVKVIDTSTAHRTAEGWTYGFPEIVGCDEIKGSYRIANPGCHASGFIALVYPLRKAGLISAEEELSCFSLTGYTGGGKKMITEYEGTPGLFLSPRQYGLTQKHKHLPEMQKVCMLSAPPCFCPVVSSFPCGMEVTVPLFGKGKFGIEEVKETYKKFYTGKVVTFSEENESGFLASDKLAGKDGMTVSVFGSDDRMVAVARFDNLGKGASGSAIQNLNLIIGAEETTGLIL